MSWNALTRKLAELQSVDALKVGLGRALGGDLPYEDRAHARLKEAVGEVDWKSASVLVLFGYYNQNPQANPSVLFIKRTETVEKHKGQMAFPGGQVEKEDGGDPIQTALRETHEEIGLESVYVEVIGHLPVLRTVTGYLVQPVVGVLKSAIEEVGFRADPFEIADVVWIPLSGLVETYEQETVNFGGELYPIEVFEWESYRIWGATGSMTKNLLDRLDRFD